MSTSLSGTMALCNECGTLTQSKVESRDNRVYLVKWCEEHGKTEALICSDVDWYLSAQSFIKPATDPKSRAVDTFNGCPHSCGLCPEHSQHTCVPLFEITDQCDMNCPICLVDGKSQREISIGEANNIFGKLVDYEGRINMLTLSGGEPTSHPRFLEIVTLACNTPEIGVVSVSTNGLRLEQDAALLKALVARGVVISLQFDGFDSDASRTLRGRADLPDIKRRLIDKVVELGGKLSLTVTLAKGVNEGAIQDALDLFFEHDRVVSIMVQPLAHMDNLSNQVPYDPSNIITIPDVVTLLADSSDGKLAKSDFTPLPCSHPSCFALTYLLKTIDGKFVSLPSLVDMPTYLDTIKNQALFNTDADSLAMIQNAIYELWSAQNTIPESESVLQTVKQILKDVSKMGSNQDHKKALDVGIGHVKSIFIHHFMDRATFDLSRAIKCCNHYPDTNGRLYPACVRNNII